MNADPKKLYTEELKQYTRKKMAGIDCPVFGSFDEAEEAKVARIDPRSIAEAAIDLGASPEVDAVFLSCTNLRTYAAIPEIETRIGKPVMSSNQALAWHMKHLEATVPSSFAT